MLFTIVSILIISILGTLSHFMYDVSKHNKVVGLFSAVNESTWEHIKIALTPIFFWSLIDGALYGSNPNYFLAKLVSLLVVIVLMPILFYGYKTLLNREIVFINIINFYIVIICSQLAFSYLVHMEAIDFIYSYMSCIGLFIVFGGYMVLTLMPIKSFIFKDPISHKYGFRGHTETFSMTKKNK